MLQSVLAAYEIGEVSDIEPLGNGLINKTWKITAGKEQYVLQRINEQVFKDPLAIAGNISLMAGYLEKHAPGYYFVAPIPSRTGDDLVRMEEEGCFRLFPFVPDSYSKDVAETPAQAYEAAVQFGRFTRLLSGLDVSKLQTTIPSFHDLPLRYKQFTEALRSGNQQRVTESTDVIKKLITWSFVVEEYEHIVSNPEFRLRVTHHDTKISNVLFDKDDNGLCVIDLDTVMPGYFISDVGDMMRTYLSPVSEEEEDFDKIEIRYDFYEAVVQGYYNEMKEELTETEKEYFFYAGLFMIYMQALRFLTDYLNNDSYYGARYPKHNFVRALNQVTLLQRLLEKQKILEDILKVQ